MTWFISVRGQRDPLDRQRHLNEDLRMPKIDADGMLKKRTVVGVKMIFMKSCIKRNNICGALKRPLTKYSD